MKGDDLNNMPQMLEAKIHNINNSFREFDGTIILIIKMVVLIINKHNINHFFLCPSLPKTLG